jgi:hypothetical protein
VDVEKLGNRAVPMMQSQARVTKNRIEFFLLTQLERLVGGDIKEPEVEALITRYLNDNDMKLMGQIHGFQGLKCRKDEIGRFHITVGIRWAAKAKEFLIDVDKPVGSAKEEPKP